jgi:ribonuclease Z
MPKEEKHLKALRLLKKEKKNRRILDQPHKIYLQVIGGGGPGSPTSLFLYTDFQGYFFNCGEGSQRMSSFVNMSKSIAQTENVFLTSNTWKNMGGLPGLCLTVRSYGSTEMTIHGPPGCMDIYEATKNFLVLMEFDVHEYTDRVYSDNSVKIEEILLHGTTPSKPPDIDITWSVNAEEDDISREYVNSVQAYILTFVPRVGKLNVEKCVDAGVTNGPLFGKLKAGEDVVLENGRVVKSSDVVGESSPATSCIVLEIPSIEFLGSLENSYKLKESKQLEYIFHFTPSLVAKDPRYVSWMQTLPPTVKHVFLNDNSSGMGLNAVTAHQTKLRYISPEMFPALVGSEHDPTPEFNLESNLCTRSKNLNIVQGKAGLKFNVRPYSESKVELDESIIYDESAVTKEVLEGSEFKCEVEKADYVEGLKQDLQFYQDYKSRIESSSDPAPNFPVITFLGTGSAVPSKYRNVSSILVEVKLDSFLLMDCGEGTLSQLYRLHGNDEADRILMNMTAIYISHQHADHQLGSINIILAREEAFRKVGKPVENLYIIVTGKYAEYLVTYHRKIQSVLRLVQTFYISVQSIAF